MTKTELVNGCIKGNAKYQELLFRQYFGKMMSICSRYAKDTDEAKDIVQDSFIKAFKSIAQLKEPETVEAWLKRIVVNTALTELRKKVNQVEHVDIEEQVNISNEDFERLNDKYSTEDILLIIQNLPEHYRMVFNLFVMEGYSHAEIAKELDINENLSKTKLSRARLLIKQKMELMDISGIKRYA